MWMSLGRERPLRMSLWEPSTICEVGGDRQFFEEGEVQAGDMHEEIMEAQEELGNEDGSGEDREEEEQPRRFGRRWGNFVRSLLDDAKIVNSNLLKNGAKFIKNGANFIKKWCFFFYWCLNFNFKKWCKTY